MSLDWTADEDRHMASSRGEARWNPSPPGRGPRLVRVRYRRGGRIYTHPMVFHRHEQAQALVDELGRMGLRAWIKGRQDERRDGAGDSLGIRTTLRSGD